jgi:hypothetical protein
MCTGEKIEGEIVHCSGCSHEKDAVGCEECLEGLIDEEGEEE